jgi:Na+-translocating ferredoxin:NAD+ oxidoreductase subunit B
MLPKPPVPIEPRVTLCELGRDIDALLPQTQCQRCGYPSCAAYAQAIANDEVAINQCPPGGDAGIHALAALTAKPYAALNPNHGTETALTIARIDESACIGCTLCLQACPVDAIVGANKRMHTVIADECSGCELCVPVCPVDCIVLETPAQPIVIDARLRMRWRARHERHLDRYWNEVETPENAQNVPTPQIETRSSALARALERAKSRL